MLPDTVNAMIIKRNLHRDGTLAPSALNYLAGVPPQYLFFVDHQLRHPASIYNLSLAKVTKVFLTLTDKYAEDTIRFHVDAGHVKGMPVESGYLAAPLLCGKVCRFRWT